MYDGADDKSDLLNGEVTSRTSETGASVIFAGQLSWGGSSPLAASSVLRQHQD